MTAIIPFEHIDLFPKLQRFSNVFAYCAGEDTAYHEYKPKEFGPLHNHCGCVSYALSMLLGGTIIGGKVHGVRHFWNELSEGVRIDLCAEQFGEPRIVFFPWDGSGKKARIPAKVNSRYLKFYNRVEHMLYQ